MFLSRGVLTGTALLALAACASTGGEDDAARQTVADQAMARTTLEDPAAVNAQADAEPIQIRIGTGGITGLYHAWGSSICRLLSNDSHFACSVVSTDGSVDNILRIYDGSIDLAIVQADVQARAFNSEAHFEKIDSKKPLRHIATLTAEVMTAIVKPGVWTDPGAEQPPLAYLGGNLSGARSLFYLAEKFGFEPDATEFVADDLGPAASVDAFCDGQFDLLFYLIGHPNDVTSQATRQCGAELRPLAGPISTGLVDSLPHLDWASIPAKFYPTVDEDITTFGTRATLIAPDDVPEKTIVAVSNALFANLDEIRRLHLAFADLETADLAAACNTAPLHEGAQNYRAENGINPTACTMQTGAGQTGAGNTGAGNTGAGQTGAGNTGGGNKQ